MHLSPHMVQMFSTFKNINKTRVDECNMLAKFGVGIMSCHIYYMAGTVYQSSK